MPILNQAVAAYSYPKEEIKAMMLAKLKAGYGIDAHIDGSPSYYFLHKIHILIQTNE